jgi:peptidoglycan/LPS O-acetylase OafA/YrhL
VITTVITPMIAFLVVIAMAIMLVFTTNNPTQRLRPHAGVVRSPSPSRVLACAGRRRWPTSD